MRMPELRFCMDNAAMIAALGYQHYLRKEFATLGLEAQAS